MKVLGTKAVLYILASEPDAEASHDILWLAVLVELQMIECQEFLFIFALEVDGLCLSSYRGALERGGY